MHTDTRTFIIALGGYKDVAKCLGKKPTTVHTHMQAGKLPASWYDALCKIARDHSVDEPAREIFSFISASEDAA